MTVQQCNFGTVEEAAEILRVSQRTVRRRISDGTLEAQRFGPRLIRINLDSIAAATRPFNGGGEQR
jgi:excisionase family DNA binding protein